MKTRFTNDTVFCSSNIPKHKHDRCYVFVQHLNERSHDSRFSFYKREIFRASMRDKFKPDFQTIPNCG